MIKLEFFLGNFPQLKSALKIVQNQPYQQAIKPISWHVSNDGPLGSELVITEYEKLEPCSHAPGKVIQPQKSRASYRRCSKCRRVEFK